MMRALAIKFSDEEIESLDAYCREYPAKHNGLKVARAEVIRMFVRRGREAVAADEERAAGRAAAE